MGNNPALSAGLNDTLFKSSMTYQEVYDLIPVKPLADNEKEIKDIYDLKLKGLHNKLTLKFRNG